MSFLAVVATTATTTTRRLQIDSVATMYLFSDTDRKYGLNDGQWHTVNIDYRDWKMLISLDECDVGLTLANPHLYDVPCAMQLDLDLTKT